MLGDEVLRPKPGEQPGSKILPGFPTPEESLSSNCFKWRRRSVRRSLIDVLRHLGVEVQQLRGALGLVASPKPVDHCTPLLRAGAHIEAALRSPWLEDRAQDGEEVLEATFLFALDRSRAFLTPLLLAKVAT